MEEMKKNMKSIHKVFYLCFCSTMQDYKKKSIIVSLSVAFKHV